MKRKDSNVTLPMSNPNELRNLIAQNAVALEIPAKTVFLKPGDVLEGVYYIAGGRTRHYMIAPDGTEKILYTLSAGWFYGETPCALHDVTGLFSKAEVASLLYCIPTDKYQMLLKESPLFCEEILLSYSKKMRILQQEIASLVFTPCKDRLKQLYCSTVDTGHVVDGGWYDLKINYTQYEISTIVGSARVTVSKLINELCAEGFIRLLNRKTQVNIRQYEAEMGSERE